MLAKPPVRQGLARFIGRPRFELASCSRLLLVQVSGADLRTLAEEECVGVVCTCVGLRVGQRRLEKPESGRGNRVPSQRE